MRCIIQCFFRGFFIVSNYIIMIIYTKKRWDRFANAYTYCFVEHKHLAGLCSLIL